MTYERIITQDVPATRCRVYRDMKRKLTWRSHAARVLRRRFFPLPLVAVAVLTLSARPSNAADLANLLTGFSLTSWGQKDGLPPSVIWTVARDREGYLWLGTDEGPIRFDGVRFVPWRMRGFVPLPASSVRALWAALDGSIWMGFGESGGVSRMLNGAVRNYGRDDGLPEGAITLLMGEPDGSLWAGNRRGLYRLTGDRWELAGHGLPQAPIYSMFVDHRGRRFVGTAEGLFRHDPSQEKFERFDDSAGPIRGVVGDDHGRLWVTDPVRGFRQLSSTKEVPAARGNGLSLLHDSKRNLWVGTGGQGLWRVRADAAWPLSRVERTMSLIGFSDDGVTSIVEDDDGTIWIATYDGLNRLVPHKMTPVTNLGVIGGLEGTRDGSVWLGAVDALIQFGRSQVTPVRTPQDFHGTLPSAMHADRAGTLWVATNRELLRIVDGQSTIVPLLAPPLTQISAITSDVQGGIWLADRERGLFRWSNGIVSAVAVPTALANVPVLHSRGVRSGDAWFSFADGSVGAANVNGDFEVRIASNVSGGSVFRAIYEDAAGTIWLGRTDAIVSIANGRMTTLGRTNGFPAGSVISIVEDERAGLWLGLEGLGIVRIGADELRKAQDSSSYQIRYRLYDKFDGFAGAPRWRGNSSSARSEDGRLWFVSARGVTTLEPHTLDHEQAVPTRISIEGAAVDGQKIQTVQSVRLSARTVGIEVDYTVQNLLSPLKTRFRYRLEGFDPDWIDAGTRRQASYTNLPRRLYRFRVQASNADGTWNEQDASWDFSINAHFYQTGWFIAACIALVVAVPWAAWRLRIRQMRKQFSLLLAERTRLSREIHDTVLQGLIGVGLQCYAIARQLEVTPVAVTSERLLGVRRDAEEFVREARQSILNLRSPKLQAGDLISALRQAGERATAGHSISFDMAVTGTPTGRWAGAEQQLYRIAQEALANAVRHSRARQVHLELCHEPAAIVLRITDDGQGFDVETVVDDNGHCGLLSMKERAEAVAGSLTITSSEGHGSRIEAVVPTSPT